MGCFGFPRGPASPTQTRHLLDGVLLALRRISGVTDGQPATMFPPLRLLWAGSAFAPGQARQRLDGWIALPDRVSVLVCLSVCLCLPMVGLSSASVCKHACRFVTILLVCFVNMPICLTVCPSAAAARGNPENRRRKDCPLRCVAVTSAMTRLASAPPRQRRPLPPRTCTPH